MANTPERISVLPEKTTLVGKDLFVTVDSQEPDIKKRTKKVKYSNVLVAIEKDAVNKVNSIPPGGFVKVENIYLKETDEELVLIT